MTLSALLLAFLAPVAMGTSLTATMDALLQEHPSVASVRVDFRALLTAAGIDRPFDPASVEVRTPDGAPVAVRVTADEGIHRVCWAVPAAGQREAIGTQATFKLRFGGGPGASPALDHAENLIYNGAFTRLDDDGVPLGVISWVSRHYGSGDLRTVSGSDGGNAISFNANPERSFSVTTPWVRIKGGTAYEYRLRYRAEGARPHHYNLVAHAWANFLDGAGKTLPRVAAMTTRTGESGGWREQSLRVEVPAAAVSTNIEFQSHSGEPWSVTLDEVGIAPTRPPEILEARVDGGGLTSLQSSGKHVYRFDLGPADAPVMDGFLPLTPASEYSAAKGYGFTRLGRPFARDGGFTDDLSRDLLAAERADFRLDIPNGQYRVWLLTGDPQARGTLTYFYFDTALNINGREVYRDTTTPAEYFRTEHYRNFHHFWVPGMDYYDTFVVPRFREHRFDVLVEKGRLDFSWRNLPVCAMIVFPAADADAVTGEIDYLRGRRRRDTAVTIAPGPVEDSIKPTRAESRRGLILFRRPANAEIFPSSRPQAGERLERLSTFGVPGQTVAVHFSLYPLRDLGPVGIRLDGLRQGRRRIAAEAVETRVVRYFFRRAGGGKFRVSPFLLDRRDAVPANRGTTWSWYVLVHLPADAAPGAYRGEIEVVSSSARRALTRIPMAVQVLPFRLEPLPIAQGYYYFPSEPWYSTFWGANVIGPRYRDDPEILALIAANERREIRFMKALGLNSIAFGDDMRGDLKLVDGEARFAENNRLAFWMDIYADEGMGVMPFYGFGPIGQGNTLSWLDRKNLEKPFTAAWIKAYRGLVQDGVRLRQERGWPEILWYQSDELSNHGESGAKEGVKLAQALRGIEGARVIASMNGPWEQIMVPYLDISMPNIAFPITEETIAKIRAAGSELWLYNCGSQRLTLGLYPWRVQAGGRFQWHYRQLGGEQWDDGTGRGILNYAIALSGPDEVYPAIAAQIQREAIYDHRYIVTLEKAMNRVRQQRAARPDPARREALQKAEEFIAYLRSRVPVDVRKIIGFRVDPRAAEAAIGGEFRDTDNLDRVRWAAAQLIVELEEVGNAQ